MDLPADIVDRLNAGRGGWSIAMGLRFVRASFDEIAAEVPIGPSHLQPQGVVHGGVHAGIIETLASAGAAIGALARGQSVVGLENHTSFLHAVRGGTLRASARPLMRGRRTQVWEGAVHDEAGRLVASGRVRLLCLEPGSSLAGETVRPPKG